MLARKTPTPVAADDLVASLNHDLRPVVERVTQVAPGIWEVVIRAPMAAREYQPGQFFRLQNYEANATRVDDTLLALEGVALTGAWVDRDKGLVALISLDMGGSTTLIKHLQPGEPVVLMGPTGAPTEVAGNETVLMAGGGLGNAVLMAINKAYHEAGARVLYFAAYKGIEDRFHIDEIEKNSDVVVWCCDEAPGFTPGRAEDKAFVGNIVEGMAAYARGELGEVDIPLNEIDRVIAIGGVMMMKAVGDARKGVLKEYLNPDHVAIASINSPMQCMMKEICAQCLQPHKNPETGEETIVFSCFEQDQDLDRVDFGALHQRLCQNSVQEKLTAQWIARCLGSEKGAVELAAQRERRF